MIFKQVQYQEKKRSISMLEYSERVKNRRWWQLAFLVIAIASGVHAFRFTESETRKLHIIDCPIAGTVTGHYRIKGAAYRADGSDEVLQSRLNSSNVVFYLLEQAALIDGAWVPQPQITDSVPYLLRDDSGDIYMDDVQVVDAFSREVERMNVRQRQAMLMVAEPAVAIGKVELGKGGKRSFDGVVTPTRFFSDSPDIFVLFAKYSVYINMFFFVVTLAADYRSSRYGRGTQTIACLLATTILVLCVELCLYREGHKHLFAEYQDIHQNLVSAEDRLPRGAWILGVDAYNEHAQTLADDSLSFPANVAIKVFGLKVPKVIER